MRLQEALAQTSIRILLGGILVSGNCHSLIAQIPVVQGTKAPIVRPADVVQKAAPTAAQPAAGTPNLAVPVAKQSIPIVSPVSAGTQGPQIPIVRPATNVPGEPAAAGNAIPIVRPSNASAGPTTTSTEGVPPSNPVSTAPAVVAPPSVGNGTLPVLSNSWTPVQPAPVRTSEAATPRVAMNNPLAVPQPVRGNDTYRVGSGRQDPAGAAGGVMSTGQGPEVSPQTSDSGSPATIHAVSGQDGSGATGTTGIEWPADSGTVYEGPVIGRGYLHGHQGPVRRIASHIRGHLDGFGAGSSRFGMCGFCPDSTRYIIFDALNWQREGGDVVGTDFGGVSGSDAEFGARITLGRREDSVSGDEISYLGMRPMESTLNSVSPGGAIDALFVPGGGFGALQLGAFYGAEETTQTLTTQLHSLQFNRVRHSWDVARTHLGWRYIWLEDDYNYASRSGADTGEFSVSANNHLFGPEAGVEWLYDVGRRISWSAFGRIGGYVNLNEVETTLVSNGTTYLANGDTNGSFAATVDLGANAHLHLTRHTRLRAGYSAMFLWGVASSTSNYPTTLSPSTGLSVDDSDSVFFHGLNLGIEIFR